MRRKIARNITKREHALLSASGAHRWSVCTPSAMMEDKYPDTQSESASEGTYAHAMAELELRAMMEEVVGDDYCQQWAELKKSEFYSKALVDYVDEYVSYVTESYNEALVMDTGAALLLEQHLDFSPWVPEGFGRGDAIIVSDDRLHIIDLKYGRNVPVSAENNPQLRLYALGAYNELYWLYLFKEVTMSIVQPRNGGITTETLSLNELLKWGQQIRDIAKVAIKGEGELVPGEHCRFCKAAPRCRKLQEEVMSIDTKKELTDSEVSDVLAKADVLISWLHKVQDYALTEARDNGHRWPGFKLVEGRSNRKYSDEEQVAKRLLKEGLTAEQIYKPRSLVGVTDMQKLLGKRKFDGVLSEYLIKPPGKPTLVPESDKRPEWNSPEEDFA